MLNFQPCSFHEKLILLSGQLSLRKWSLYGCHSLRHYNELSHQFKERISRAIKPSNRYLESFLSYPLIECAKFISFLTSAILGVFIILSIVDDDFLRIEHVLSSITLLTLVLGITLSMIPDENYGLFFNFGKNR